MKTNRETLAAANWDQLEADVVAKIRILKAVSQKLEASPMADKICEDIVLPLLQTLAEFCAGVQAQAEPPLQMFDELDG